MSVREQTTTRDWAAFGAVAVMAGWVTFGVLWRRAQHGLGEVAYDFYGLFYPNAVYAIESARHGGHGLLWTPYQACGLPFLANSEVGLLYPGHLVFALLPREPALLASVLLHLTIAGMGAFLLCREMGLRAPAALAGALAFELGWYTVQFAGWGPIHLSTYAWMSVAAWRAERLVRRLTLGNAVLLALVLAVQLLAGFIQISYFTYALVASRIAWAAAMRESARPLALLAHGALALALPVALTAVVLLPAREMARESLRGGPLAAHDIGPGFSWRLLAETIWSQVTIPFNALVLSFVVLAGGLLGRPGMRAPISFHTLVIGGCLVLSLGPGSRLWELYARLPLATSFRGSGRLLWIAHLSGAVLVAFGAEAAARALGRGGWLLPVALAANALVLGPVPFFGYRTGDVYDRSAKAFAFVRARLTAQDRVHVVGKPRDLALAPKSPSWFGVPGIYDYEALAPRRYAEFFAYMRTGHALRGLADWQWILDQQLPPNLRRPLFDRTAARYLLVDRDIDPVPAAFGTGIRLLTEIDGVRIYENEQALPRARVVASAAIVPDGDVLGALAAGRYDAQQTVLLDRPLPMPGSAGGPAGEATVTTDRPERVVVHVHAPSAALVVLADAFYPGWTATVNGVQREILRADYAFRAVLVPAGESEVVFAYRPASLERGAIVSVASVALLVAMLVVRRRSAARGGSV